MTNRHRKYLSDVLHSCACIESFLKDAGTFEAYQNDAKTRAAVERHLGIIGEAVNLYLREPDAKPLPDGRRIVDFRNRLIHSYDNVDDAIVWAVVKTHLPELRIACEGLLAE